jgi:D-alanine-D-alanine ligase
VIVAVLAGGRSSEHDVSLASAEAVRAGLRAAGHTVRAIDLERDGTWRFEGEELALRPGRGLLDAEVAFPVLHGPFGEDGTVQGLLELLDVPYVGSGVAASAVCMDKLLLKDLMAAGGVPQVAYGRPGDAMDSGWPRWVKPARLGSSVGIVRVERPEDMDAAVRTALEHDPRVIVEAHADGLEVECAVLGGDASEPGEIALTGDGWYDYEAKYTPGGMELVVPARISAAARERVRTVAVEAFALAGCEGLARVDFFVSGDDVWLNELNTMPGMTPTSVWGKLWEASGLAYPDALDRLCRLAAERFERERGYRF